jgi:hypothetical protein
MLIAVIGHNIIYLTTKTTFETELSHFLSKISCDIGLIFGSKIAKFK